MPQISRAVDGDAALPGVTRSQQITVQAEQQLWPEPLLNIPGSSWIVILYIARLMSGSPVHLQLNGSRGASGTATLLDSDWQMLASVVEVPGQNIQQIGLLHSVNSGRSEIRVGGLALLTFENRQSAINFVNRMVFPA
ncbi:hypothetical protein PIB19_22315 [Sphingomonas sp. 7/4-4]|uniref:hypothetical protein n=1 Tax=Sphingomonas sp. 7/4-4 TaxID=3018446 RepID=UPI0022F3CF99|nr:hypothetical protein [Sphingomonas sp. 7/4-4]WBY07943.1 hypothetical protein PIB19_22315 [Sphingomonas sp. 7/4-4]